LNSSGGMDEPVHTVIVGVGNPTLSDDGVGLRVAAELADRLNCETSPDIAGGVAVTEVCAGGLRLMEAMIGYRAAVIIDALVQDGCPPGTIVELRPEDLVGTRNLTCVHDMTLAGALRFGRLAGARLPEQIRIFGVAAADVTSFSESLTPQVAAAVPILVERVLRQLQADQEPFLEPAQRLGRPAL
jgi:hydrogenase maturation protease